MGEENTIPIRVNKVEGTAGQVRASGGPGAPEVWETKIRTATYVIAASDASDAWKRSADRICDGTNDEVDIQALNDLFATFGGTIVLSEGNFYIEDDLTINNCTLIGQGNGGPTILYGTRLNMSDTKTITIQRGVCGGRLHEVLVYCPNGYTGDAVEINGTTSLYGDVKAVLQNVRIYNYTFAMTGTPTGRGLWIHAEAAGANVSVATCTFNNVTVQGFEYGAHLTAENSATHDGYVNENTFFALNIMHCKHPLILDNAGANPGAVSGNKFIPLYIESYNGATNGVHLAGTVVTNYLLHWDWTAVAWYTGSSILCDAGTLRNWIEGNFDVTDVVDNGTDNNIRRTTVLQRHKMVIALLKDSNVIAVNNPGVAYVDVNPYIWVRPDFSTILRVIQARIVVTASGNEAGAGKGIEIWNNTGGVQICEITWDGVALLQAVHGAWSTTNLPAANDKIQARCKGSTGTEDLTIWNIDLEIDYE